MVRRRAIYGFIYGHALRLIGRVRGGNAEVVWTLSDGQHRTGAEGSR